MTSEQYSAVELLAKIEDESIEEYIHHRIKDAIPTHIDSITNEKERVALQKDWDEGITSFDTSRKITVRCELGAHSKQIEVISKIAQANDENPSAPRKIIPLDTEK